MKELAALQATAGAIATLDVLCALTETARLFGYCRPVLSEGLDIQITDGRHPVLDQSLVEEKFVPNDVQLDGDRNRLLILTGPNMAGKSTYIRQVALLVAPGPDRLVGAGEGRGDRARGPHLHACRSERRSLARPIDFHGRDE